MENKNKYGKHLRIDNELFYILKKVSVDDTKWSKTARKYLWQYCKAVHGDAVAEIEKSYQLADDVLKSDSLVKEIIQDDI